MRKHPILFPKFLSLKNEPKLFKILDEHDSIYDHVMAYCDGCRFYEGCGSIGRISERFCEKWLANAKADVEFLGYAV